MKCRYRASWENVATLDADHMASWGAFIPGALQTIEFGVSEVPSLYFEMQDKGDYFRVFYKWVAGKAVEPELVRSSAYLDHRPCRFGGTRAYFIAPCCSRRVLRLAVQSLGLVCGACGRLTWSSRRERPIARLIRKANKLSNRLGCDSWRDAASKRAP